MQIGTIYKTDGSTEVIRPAKGGKFSLDEMQAAVGGYIESLVPGIKGCRQMYCNEDGIAKNLPPNPHTWSVVNAKVYRLNEYPSNWRVAGNIIAITTEKVQKEEN
jgi:hypothetical protein